MPPTAQFSVSVPTTSHLGDESRDDLRALGGGRVVRLEGEAGEPELGEPLRERAVVDPPLGHVRSDVDVQVVRALHEGARALARSTSRRRDCVVIERDPIARLVARSASTAALAAATRGSTPSSSSRSRAASISSTRRTACVRLPSSSALEEWPPITAAISLLEPLAVAAASAAAAGSRRRRPRAPFMKTERRSFSGAASPGCSETTSTGMPSGSRTPRRRRARRSRRRAPACRALAPGRGRAARRPRSARRSRRRARRARASAQATPCSGRRRSRRPEALAVPTRPLRAPSPPSSARARRRAGNRGPRVGGTRDALGGVERGTGS